jgi:hypothetical protein
MLTDGFRTLTPEEGRLGGDVAFEPTRARTSTFAPGGIQTVDSITNYSQIEAKLQG